MDTAINTVGENSVQITPKIIPDIVRVAHFVLYVTDLAASRRFYVELLGLNVLHEAAGALYLRGNEDREWTLKLEEAATAGLKQVGYRVRSPADLLALVALAEAEGLPYRFETELDRPRLLRLQDPFGNPLAFYAESVTHPWLLQRYDLQRGCGIQRIDHINMTSSDVAAQMRWYMQQLGFRLSEYTEDDAGDVWAAWLQRRGSVHDLALTNGDGPRLHHIAFWLPDVMAVIKSADILAGAKLAEQIERGPGRHGISNAFFIYLRDPDGLRVELYTSDYLTVDPDFLPIRWSRDDPRRQTFWGAKTPRSWFEEASAVAAFAGGWQAQEKAVLAGMPAHVT
jgi:catechol 2,3-dioxygenase